MNDDRYYSQSDLNRCIPRSLVLSSFAAIHALILYCSPSALSQNISREHRETLERLLSSYNNVPPYSIRYSSDSKVLDREGITAGKKGAFYQQEGIIRKSDRQVENIYTAYMPEEELNDLYQGEKLIPFVAGHAYWDRGENRKLSYTDSTPGTPEGKYAIVWPDLKLSLGISPDSTGWWADGVIVDSQHFSETLLNSNDLTVQTEKNRSGESVLRFAGSTPFGRLAVWVSDGTQPQFQRASFVASDEYLKGIQMNRWTFDVTILERKEIDGTVVVTKARRLNTFKHADGTAYRSEQIVNRSEIEFNPDFEKAGAFDFDLPNGTIVYPYAGGPNADVEFLWQDGRLVPHIAAGIDRAIDQLLDSPMAEVFRVDSKTSSLPQETSMPDVRDQLPEQAVLAESRSRHDLFIILVIVFVLVVVGTGLALFRYRVKNDAGDHTSGPVS